MSLPPGIAGEGPLEYLSRQGYEVHCYDHLFIARKFAKDRRCVSEESGETARKLATKLGWYP